MTKMEQRVIPPTMQAIDFKSFGDPSVLRNVTVATQK